MSTIKQIYELDTCYTAVKLIETCVVGVELEIENIKANHCGFLEEEYGIVITEDGSLRNNGYEYLITPRTVAEAVDTFAKFHQQKGVSYGSNAFSPRTSIHVHVNCMNMEEEQVRNLLFLYSIFEPVFFSFVGSERKNNIHCVPLSYTHMSHLYKYVISDIRGSWHKYTAFNIIPLGKLGTVEFRHMGGHNNVPVFAAWLGMIEVLWNAARTIPPIIPLSLIDLRWLEDIQRNLITKDVIALSKEPINFDLKRNLIDVKLGLM